MTFSELMPTLTAFAAGGGFYAIKAIAEWRKAEADKKKEPLALPAPAPAPAARESDEELKAKFLHRAAVERIEAAVSEAIDLLRVVAKDADGAQKASYKTATGFDNLVTQTAHVWDSTERALAEAKLATEAINEAVETLQSLEVAAKP